MWVNGFVVIVVYIFKAVLYMLVASLHLAWGMLKWEGRAIKNSFKNYPIGFISFFIHFIGFWIVFGWGNSVGNELVCRLYTLGLVKDAGTFSKIAFMPMELIVELTLMESVIMQLIGGVLMMFLWIPAFILVFQIWLFLFPIIYAILTQMILGIPFRGFILRWRRRREEKENRKLKKRLMKSRTTQSNNYNNSNMQKSIATGGNEEETYVFPAEQRTKYRDLDENFEKVKKRIDDRTFRLYHAHEELVAKKGKNAALEKIYQQTIDSHNDMQEVYMEAVETICYTNNQDEIKRCYTELKKELTIVRNAQISLTEAIKKVYGIQV